MKNIEFLENEKAFKTLSWNLADIKFTFHIRRNSE